MWQALFSVSILCRANIMKENNTSSVSASLHKGSKLRGRVGELMQMPVCPSFTCDTQGRLRVGSGPWPWTTRACGLHTSMSFPVVVVRTFNTLTWHFRTWFFSYGEIQRKMISFTASPSLVVGDLDRLGADSSFSAYYMDLGNTE